MEPDHLSASSINKYRTCPLMYRYYIEGKEEHSPFTKYGKCGTAVHETLEAYYNRTELPDIRGLIEDEECEVRFTESIDGWEKMRDAIPEENILSEQHIEVEFDGTKVIGRIDLVTEDWSQVFDHKTASGGASDKDKLQAQIYMWMIEKLRGEAPACKFLYYRSGEQFDAVYLGASAVESIVSKTLSRIRADEFPARVSSKSCGICGYKYLCEEWNSN